MSKRIHSLEGREECVHELGNAAHGKQELTCWRGGRGRSGLASSEMWHVAKRGLSWGGGGGGRVREGGKVARGERRNHVMEGGERGGGWGREVGGGKQEMNVWGGGRGGEGVVRLEKGHIAKRGLTSWRGGRGRSGLVSSETWHVAKRGLTSWRGGRGEASW